MKIDFAVKWDLQECHLSPMSGSDRTHFLERLVASRDIDPEVEAAWESEADRREAELEADEINEVPVAEAMQRLRARLNFS